MDWGKRPYQPLCMAKKKVTSRQKPTLPKNYIREWRKFRGNLTLERLADRVGTSHATLSRIERGLQPWNETLLRAISEALDTDVVNLLIRDPTDPEGIWSLWDTAKASDRQKIVETAKIILKTGT